MKIFTKKRIVILTATITTLVAVFGAVAYFTATGSGSGQATVGTVAEIALSSVTVGDLYPGAEDTDVTVDIDNSGNGATYVNDISGTVADNAGCLGAWFEVDTVSFDDTIPANTSDSAATVIRMLDTGTNQNVCKGKTITITWSSN